MILSWREDIRRGGKLRIAARSGIGQTAWKGLLQEAVREFNDLSDTYDLGVSFRENASLADAVVTVDTRPGTGLVGHAPFQSWVPHGQPDTKGRIFRCDITLPADPKVNTPQGQRRVGRRVLLVMLVHEMVHACGLSDEEHSKKGDLFMASPLVLPGDGASEDSVDSGRVDAAKDRILMPPMLLNEDTAAKIRQAWADDSTAGLSAPARSLGTARSASPRQGPVGLSGGGAAGGAAAGARSAGTLALQPPGGRLHQVWS